MWTDPLRTAKAFDVVADDYDAVYGPCGNAIMTWMRQENLALLEATFPPESYLLELGCGTGEEAIWMAKTGHRVVATDISPAMAAQAHRKARAEGLEDRIHVLALPASGIAALSPALPFDGAYASFGSLNCERDLPAVGLALAHLLRPGAAFVCSIMGPTCIFEILWYLAHARPRAAFRRMRPGWQAAPVAGTGGKEVTVPTRYLSVAMLRHMLGANFAVMRVMALPLLYPPPYADRLFRRCWAWFKRLEPLERFLRSMWPWCHWGDHTVIMARRI